MTGFPDKIDQGQFPLAHARRSTIHSRYQNLKTTTILLLAVMEVVAVVVVLLALSVEGASPRMNEFDKSFNHVRNMREKQHSKVRLKVGRLPISI